MKYKIHITKTLEGIVEVEADCLSDAIVTAAVDSLQEKSKQGVVAFSVNEYREGE